MPTAPRSHARLPLIRHLGGIAVQTPSPLGPHPIRTILGIGRNYAEHVREQGPARPDPTWQVTQQRAVG